MGHQRERELRQGDLFDPERLAATADPQEGTIQSRFLAFHAANPHVYEAFRRAALALRDRGRRRYGAKAIYETMRYMMALQTEGDEFKLNNDYTSRYARMLLERHPEEFEGFLELRRLRRD